MSEQNLTEKIAQKIFAARKASGMTQKQVATLLGISEGQFAHYEKGRAEPSINLIYQMCLLFNASFDEWLGISDKPKEINEIKPIIETTNTALDSSTLQDNHLDTKKEPTIQMNDELKKAMAERPVLRKLISILVQLDDEHLTAFLTLSNLDDAKDAPPKE